MTKRRNHFELLFPELSDLGVSHSFLTGKLDVQVRELRHIHVGTVQIRRIIVGGHAKQGDREARQESVEKMIGRSRPHPSDTEDTTTQPEQASCYTAGCAPPSCQQ
jgi:hypothetical protein